MNFARRKALTAAGVLSGGAILPGLFKAPANDPSRNNSLAQKVTREAARIRLLSLANTLSAWGTIDCSGSFLHTATHDRDTPVAGNSDHGSC